MSTASEGFEIVRLRTGAAGVRSLEFGEVWHPGIGPRAEAEALYVNGLALPRRLAAHHEPRPFVIWDIGLGGAANATAAIHAATHAPPGLHLDLWSFDRSLEGLRFALRHAADLGYFGDLAEPAGQLLHTGASAFPCGSARIQWSCVLGDFPRRLREDTARRWPAPDAILFDPHSPGANPEMWTLPLFRDLFARLDPHRPCALSTYSRSTSIRAALLLAGFHVGVGQATGLKEETTLAANRPELAGALLGSRWLQRAHRSAAAEPWTDPPYEHRPITPDTAARLAQHPQFAGTTALGGMTVLGGTRAPGP